MMYSPELSMALAHRQQRRRVSTARQRSLTDTPSLLTGRLSLSRKSSNTEINVQDDAQLPAAIKYLELVALEMSVSKKHADVRYVMTVRHHELNVAWRLARSFDEYRKLQQRLLKELQHGHFCAADCPWLYGFLKSYFPKKLAFSFSNTRVVEQRKQSLERFFAALYGFLTDRNNFCCAVVMAGFADELVQFVYGDALQQYGLENPPKSKPEQRTSGYSSRWDKPQHSERLDLQSPNDSVRSSETDDDTVKDLNCGDCGICAASLCGVAYGSSSFSVLTIESSSEEDSYRSASSFSSSMGIAPSASGSGNSFNGAKRSSSASRRRAATYYLTTLTCGHQFHDECIVPRLNESLNCPTCGRLQTNN